jgi:hypothetical protein
VIDEIVDAEVCEVAKAAREVLLKALGRYLLEELANSMYIIIAIINIVIIIIIIIIIISNDLNR